MIRKKELLSKIEDLEREQEEIQNKIQELKDTKDFLLKYGKNTIGCEIIRKSYGLGLSSLISYLKIKYLEDGVVKTIEHQLCNYCYKDENVDILDKNSFLIKLSAIKLYTEKTKVIEYFLFDKENGTIIDVTHLKNLYDKQNKNQKNTNKTNRKKGK